LRHGTEPPASSRPCGQNKNQRPPPAPDLHPRPVLANTAEPPIKKGNFQKPDYQRTRRPNCASALFSTNPPLHPPSPAPDFRPTPATPDSRGALIKPQTAMRCKQLFRKTRNFFIVSGHHRKNRRARLFRASPGTPRPPHGAGHQENLKREDPAGTSAPQRKPPAD
jgi:hypothetical protein